MTYYRVTMLVHSTTTVWVEAASPEEAKAKAEEEHEGSPVNICHQCANDLDEPTMGSATYVEEE